MGETMKRDITPVVIKVGVALALSFAGLIYSRFRARRIKPLPPPPKPRSSDHGNIEESRGSKVGRKGALRVVRTMQSCSNLGSSQEEGDQEHISTQKNTVHSPVVGFSPSSKHSGDKDDFLLPEFGDLVRDFDLAATNTRIYVKKDAETPRSDVEKHNMYNSGEKDDYEQEIKELRDMVRMLQERERSLEVQLLEYYGLREQETAVMELQNRLRINDMEARLFKLKINTLQEENQRLRAQAADYAKVTSDLESARGKIKVLRKKLRTEAEQNKEQILSLQRRVAKLQEEEHEAVANDSNIQSKLQRLKDLEGEAEELRKSNVKLEVENHELSHKLDSTQLLASSMLEDKEVEELKEIRKLKESLRQENEDLVKKVEQLEADRCADAEELVYLRWLNACLRYELRHYQHPSGKTVAKDLSKTLSPKSEEKAKQLILEYANGNGTGDKGTEYGDYETEQWSTPQTDVTDTGDFDEFSADNSPSHKDRKHRFFNKLRRLITGNHHHSQKESHHPSQKDSNHSRRSQTLSSDRAGYSEDGDSPCCSSNISTVIDPGTDGHSNRYTASSRSSSRTSLDAQRMKSPQGEGIKEPDDLKGLADTTPYRHRRWVSFKDETITEMEGSLSDQDSESTRKSDLVKYAEVLKDSRLPTPKLHRKFHSVSSF